MSAGWLPKVTVAVLIATVFIVYGCAVSVPPPEATLSPIGTYMHVAKPPDCAMPVLRDSPSRKYQQVAIVDAWGDKTAKDSDLLSLVKRKACEAGADAVVITEDRTQNQGDLLPGYGPGADTEVGPESGVNVSERVHPPEVGEVGHGGHYISAMAIAYPPNVGGKSAASNTSH